MKRLVTYLPVALLFLYVALCFYRPPEIADGIIVCAIGALYGFMVHLRAKEIPEVKRTEQEQMLIARIKELQLQREVNGLEADLARITSANEKGLGNGKGTPFIF
jgi:hypothetical protein